MLPKVIKALVQKPATVRYPYEKPEPVEGLRSGVKFNIKKCDQCQDCERVCPSAAINVTYAEKKLEYFPFRCICCHQCIASCSQGAITAETVARSPDYKKVTDVYMGMP
ncbi:MAG: 4Fe-4S dicluster domain-containing protein [Candidatus Methanomethylicus sp.]|nr:4Fe-4S dicluster domain-containing protein [Candidatus Methanomethylicus sp.]